MRLIFFLLALLWPSGAFAQSLLVSDALDNALDAYWNETTGPTSFDTTGPTPYEGTHSACATFVNDEDAPFYVRKTSGFSETEYTVGFRVHYGSTFDFPTGIKTHRVYYDGGGGATLQFTLTLFDTDVYRLEHFCPSAECGSTIDQTLLVSTTGMKVTEQWQHVILRIKLNTPSSADGEAHLYVDGDLVASATSADLRGSSSNGLNGIWVGGNYTNGGTDPATTSERCFDEIILYSGDARNTLLGASEGTISAGGGAWGLY